MKGHFVRNSGDQSSLAHAIHLSTAIKIGLGIREQEIEMVNLWNGPFIVCHIVQIFMHVIILLSW